MLSTANRLKYTERLLHYCQGTLALPALLIPSYNHPVFLRLNHFDAEEYSRVRKDKSQILPVACPFDRLVELLGASARIITVHDR